MLEMNKSSISPFSQEDNVVSSKRTKSRRMYDVGSVKIYNKKINRHAGDTSHFANERSYRELALKGKLGVGNLVVSFVLKTEEGDLQIHEILDNGVVSVYSYLTHKKITIFAATPFRIASIYEYAGLIPPDWLLSKCEENFNNEYNKL